MLIVVQISNFGYANGGFVTGIELGDVIKIVQAKNKKSFTDIFLFGSISIIGLYHLALYVLRRNEYSTLYFGIICLLIAIRVLLFGEMLLYTFFPAVPLFVFLKASMLALYLGLILLVMFIGTIFPEDTPQWFIRFSQITGLFFSAITIVLPDKFSYMFHTLYEIIGLFILLVLAKILIKAVIAGRESSFLVTAAVLSIIVFTVNDILNSYGIILTGYFIPLGLLLFIFIQSFMLSKKYEKAFFTVKVQENQLLKSELRMLQAQIKPHFLFNTLNTIISVCSVSSDKAEELLVNLSNYLRCGFSFKNDDEFVDFETELLHVSSYLSIEKERFSGKLNIVLDIDSNIQCKVPPYILQPIVENAVRHGILPSENGGTVMVKANRKNNMLLVTIEDDGVGMTEEKLNSILNGSDKKAGIGVTNVTRRLQKIYGNPLKMESSVGVGTIVTITIPLSLEERRHRPYESSTCR